MQDEEENAYLEVTDKNGAALFRRQIRGEVVMLNLLRFRSVADYSGFPDLAPSEEVSGREAYLNSALPLQEQEQGERRVATQLSSAVRRRGERSGTSRPRVEEDRVQPNLGGISVRIQLLFAFWLLSRCNATAAQSVAPLVHERTINAPLAKVWDSWTTSEGLRSWLAPHAEIDFRIAGTMRANYNPDGKLGDAQTIENTVLSYDPYKMIAIRVAKAPNDFPFPNAIFDMWTVIYFETDGSERTKVRVVANGFSADEESQAMRAFFDQGNAITLRQMQERIGEVAP